MIYLSWPGFNQTSKVFFYLGDSCHKIVTQFYFVPFSIDFHKNLLRTVYIIGVYHFSWNLVLCQCGLNLFISTKALGSDSQSFTKRLVSSASCENFASSPLLPGSFIPEMSTSCKGCLMNETTYSVLPMICWIHTCSSS